MTSRLADSGSGANPSAHESTREPATRAADPIAVFIGVCSAVIAALPGLVWLAHRVHLPGTGIDGNIVGMLAHVGNSKPFEFALFALAVALSALVIPRVWRIVERALARDDRIAGWCVVVGLAISALGCHILQSTVDWIRAIVPVFALAGSWCALLLTRRFADRCGESDRIFCNADRIGALGMLLAAIAGAITIFVVSVGPRTAGDLPIASCLARLAGIALGSMISVLGVVAILRAIDPRYETLERAICAGRHTAWLMLAALAPNDLRILGIAIAACFVGMGCELWRGRTLPLDSAEAWRILVCFFLPTLVLVLCDANDPHGAIDFFHTGETATIGYEFLHGKRPFADLYVQHGWLRNVVLPALSFELLEPTLEAARRFESLTRAATHVGAFVLGCVVLRSPWLALAFALACGSLDLWFADRFLPVFLMLTLLIAGFGLQVRSVAPILDAKRLAGAGALAVVCLAWSVDVGIFASATIVVFAASEAALRAPESGLGSWFRTWVAICRPLGIGAALMLVLVVAILFATSGSSAVAASVENLSRQSSLQLATWGIPFPNPFVGGEAFSIENSPTQALLALTTCLTAITYWVAQRGRGQPTPLARRALLLAIFGIFLFRTALGRSDDSHLRFILPFPTWIALGFGEQFVRAPVTTGVGANSRRYLRVIPLLAIAGFYISAFTPLYGMIRQWVGLSTVRAFEATPDYGQSELPRLGNVMLPREQAQMLATLHAEIEARLKPAETFFDFSNMGALYFLLDRRSPTRYIAAAYAASPEMQRELVRDLELNKPKLAFLCRSFGYETVDGLSMRERLPLVSDYLRQEYARAVDLGFGWLLTRNLDRP